MPPAKEPTGLDEIASQVAGHLRPLRLSGRVQPYAWGGFRYLRELTGLDLPADQPAAEWWIGAHPSAPSMVHLSGEACRLDELIERIPARLLGSRVVERFGPRLPFLLKVLDVRQTLSIQTHPNQAQAEAGFARETAAGIPLDAPARTYRDAQHKVEAQVALTPFWMLFGFRDLDDMGRLLDERSELRPLAERLSVLARHAGPAARPGEIVRALFAEVMTLAEEVVDGIVDSLVRRLVPLWRSGSLRPDSPDYWVVRSVEQLGRVGGHHDRGVLSIYLMNVVALEPGEGTFIGAGLLHAYLEGAAVEIMASSDNVIRGGLTTKHVDVPELLRVLRFDPAQPQALHARPCGPVERRYAAPVPDFGLSRLELTAEGAAAGWSSTGPEVLITIAGDASLQWGSGALSMSRGSAALVPSGLDYEVTPGGGPALVFRAFVPEGEGVA